jgi:uncharacterized protein (TIGR00730 family)
MDLDKNIPTLTHLEMQEVARERTSEIMKEFKDGFKLLEDYPQSVTFFGSTVFTEENEYYQSARTLAGLIVKEFGYSIISGGGPGIMEAANRGAFEAGGSSLGLTIKLPDGQVVNKYLTAQVNFYYFFVRKVCLTFSAEAFIFMPGGFGTLDEFFEVLTLVQTKKIKNVPIICVGADYWNSLQTFIGNTLLSRGTVTEEDTKLYTVTDDHREVLNILHKTPVRVIESVHSQKGA